MALLTISQISKAYGISTRTLRYYEQIGLISSIKKDDYAYRTYDEYTKRRLQQILILRKLRIKLNDIATMLDNDDVVATIEIFRGNLVSIHEEISSLTTIRDIYENLINCLSENTSRHINYSLFDIDDLIESIHDLPLSKTKLKEEKVTMEDLNKASDTRSKLQDKDVRIIYLPPCTIASAHYIGENPEDATGKMMDDFVREYGLEQTKPDIRLFGFNNPCPQNSGEPYGYEFWITVPKDLDVPKPLEKKLFEGGLYAAHCIKMGDFEEWKLVWEWVQNSEEYEYERREPLGMDGSLEEHLNAYTYYATDKKAAKFKQLDLLIPVKQK